MNVLLALLRKLGFSISYKKVEPPTTALPFLGIHIHMVSMTLALPQERVDSLFQLILDFTSKRHTTFKSLVGKLNWAAQVVRGGRAFLLRILDCMHPLRQHRHKVKLDDEFFADLD